MARRISHLIKIRKILRTSFRFIWRRTEKLIGHHAETLAFATILTDGTPIRFTGQDSERGTFAQRNIVLHDSETW